MENYHKMISFLVLMYKKTTQVPNLILDHYLPSLNLGELKILLVIIRQTNGWINHYTGKRKTYDRISKSQFIAKTGLCKRIITLSLNSLSQKSLIHITDQEGNTLKPDQRKGNPKLFYSLQLEHFITSTSAKNELSPEHKRILYKTNYTKLTMTKLRDVSVSSIGEIIAKMAK